MTYFVRKKNMREKKERVGEKGTKKEEEKEKRKKEKRKKKKRKRKRKQTSIRLASNDKGTVLVLGVLVDPLGQELVVSLGSAFVSVLGGLALVTGPVGETDKGRGLNIQNVGQLVPATLEVGQVTIFIGAEGSVLLEQTQQRRAPRSTIHPHHQRLVGGILLGLNQPVEELPPIVKSDVPAEGRK